MTLIRFSFKSLILFVLFCSSSSLVFAIDQECYDAVLRDSDIRTQLIDRQTELEAGRDENLSQKQQVAEVFNTQNKALKRKLRKLKKALRKKKKSSVKARLAKMKKLAKVFKREYNDYNKTVNQRLAQYDGYLSEVGEVLAVREENLMSAVSVILFAEDNGAPYQCYYDESLNGVVAQLVNTGGSGSSNPFQSQWQEMREDYYKAMSDSMQKRHESYMNILRSW